MGGSMTLPEGHVGRPCRLQITLPPLSTLIFKYNGPEA